MSEYSIIENPSSELWNSFLTSVSEGNYDQCFEHGEISRKAFPRTRVARLALALNGSLAGIVQGEYSSYFGFGMNVRVMRGPVVNIKQRDGPALVEKLLNALEEYGKRNRIIHAEVLVPEAWRLKDVFAKLGYSSSGKLNEYVVNIESGMDKLWESIAHNKRRNIKQAMREQVEVVKSNSYEDINTFYSMLQASAERGGFYVYPLSGFQAAWRLCQPGKLANVFFARWKDKSISGVFVVAQGKTVHAIAAGSFEEGWKVRPNDIMHWKTMEWGFQNGYTRYHMGFVSEPLPAEGSNAWGIWRWKKEWGGDLQRIEAFQKLFLPRYRFILEAKKLVERGYNKLKSL
jgi:hypothetical protein